MNDKESYFDGKAVESVFEFEQRKLVCYVKGDKEEEIQIVDRNSKQIMSKISNGKVCMYSK